MKIGAVLLGEAGNYGDDLILVAVLSAIRDADPTAEVAFLSFGNPLPLAELMEVFALPPVLERRRHGAATVWPLRHTLFADRDLVIFGGGGLLETSHHPRRPYHWLGSLPPRGSQAPVVGVGLGIGPVSEHWQRFFRRTPSPFSHLHVRDAESAQLSRSWGWDTQVCEDFIHGAFLRQWLEAAGVSPGVAGTDSGPRRLGVSLREWPGADERRMARFIMEVAKAESCTAVDFYTLESKNGRGVDVEYVHRVGALVDGLDSSFQVYDSHNLLGFTRSMASVDVAISMKLHSSAIWAAAEIPMYPVIYAPKMAAFFDRPYRGLELIAQRVAPGAPGERVSAQDVVRAALRSAEAGELPRPEWRPSTVWSAAQQARSLAVGAINKCREMRRDNRAR
ncbi:polysaccharide pyruvyl transferase family protein [Micrococcus sp. M4NT]|uniref:polysaccharide pyruvyl transferase family protein n=1 Tax=Micrococcus sp. M4NT TaxID=2957501 RepID=UPI0029BACBEC|nr:polysaccharide pyruvyl transferase family protein [Micrococcus sp. M4NT]MDX2340289.1 polysaccharide pyruvyl transferase family protein [Micrococcus sp. M4NT]